MTYAVVDLEATNHPETSEKYIIQIGITYIDDRVVSDTITIDVKPPVPIHPTITQLTGITNAHVANAPLFEDVAEYVATLLEGCVFVAHNVAFDYNLLVREMARVGVAFSEMTRMDTLDLAQIVMPMQRSFALKNLAQDLGIPLSQHHNAGDDAQATAHLFLHLCQRITEMPVSVCQDVYALLHAKGEGIARLFHRAGHVQKTMLNRDEFGVSQHAKMLHAVAMIDASMQASAYRSYRAFVDEKMLTYTKQRPEDLTLQEAKQLCRLLVSLGCGYVDGGLSELSLSQKLQRKLTSYDVDNPYYVRAMAKWVMQETLYITYADLVADFQLLQQHLDLSRVQLIIQEVNQFQYTERMALTDDVSISSFIYQAFTLKQTLAKKGEDTQRVDHAIMDLFWVIDYVKETYAEHLRTLENQEYGECYLGHLDEMNGYLWIRLKSALSTLKTVWNRPYVTDLDHVIEKVGWYLTKKDAHYYVALKLHKTDYATHYTLVVQPFSVAAFNDTRIFPSFERVTHESLLPNQADVQMYVSKMVTQKWQCDDVPQPLVGELVISRIRHAQDWKDNLMVRKIVQFAHQLKQQTIIVVPNQHVLQGVCDRDDQLLALVEPSQERIAQQLEHMPQAIVMTWRVFYACYRLLPTDVDVVLVKLPFDHPNSLHLQASKKHLAKKEHYFTTIHVLSVLLDVLAVAVFKARSGRFILWDDRMYDTSYGKQWLESLSQIVKIVEET